MPTRRRPLAAPMAGAALAWSGRNFYWPPRAARCVEGEDSDRRRLDVGISEGNRDAVELRPCTPMTRSLTLPIRSVINLAGLGRPRRLGRGCGSIIYSSTSVGRLSNIKVSLGYDDGNVAIASTLGIAVEYEQWGTTTPCATRGKSQYRLRANEIGHAVHGRGHHGAGAGASQAAGGFGLPGGGRRPIGDFRRRRHGQPNFSVFDGTSIGAGSSGVRSGLPGAMASPMWSGSSPATLAARAARAIFPRSAAPRGVSKGGSRRGAARARERARRL